MCRLAIGSINASDGMPVTQLLEFLCSDADIPVYINTHFLLTTALPARYDGYLE